MNIIVSGGSGFIGRHLVPVLVAAGHSVFVWSRTPERESRENVRAYRWNPLEGPPPAGSFEGVDAVINLAGETVGQKWSDEVKRKIRESRVAGTRYLIEGLKHAPAKPSVLVSSSAVGYYGDRGEEELTEPSAPGDDFLADVTQAWEHEADGAAALGIRVVKIRTGVVLGAGGGALAKLVPAFRTKIGGKLGSGKQWMSWIHVSDLADLYRFAVEGSVAGVLNGVAPNPVRNDAFTEALGEALHQPTKITVPEFALRMMFGEMADTLLASQRVLPQATEQAGFTFRFPEILPALKNAVAGS